MGQKIEYKPDEWDFQEENQLTPIRSEISLPDDFFKGSPETRQSDSNVDSNDFEITAYINGEAIQINHQDTDGLPASQEEEAFRRQIEDLFELLELEKKSNKTDGVRVYQTDSSPSRPWRFH